MAAGRFAVLLLASAVLAGPALAQPASPPAVPAMGDGAGRWKERRGEWEARRQARDRLEAADVALLLRLRPDQQAAYQAWQASMRPPEGERPGRRGDKDDAAPEPPAQTTAQTLDQMQAQGADREARMRARLEATRRFYALLSPDQQALFDALMRLRHGGGEGEHGRGSRGGPPIGERGDGPAGAPERERPASPPPGS